jgi:DNA-binding response OmpR family regulator
MRFFKRQQSRHGMNQLIFIVESDLAVAETVCECLQSAGYDCRSFTTTDLFEEAETQRPSLILIAMRVQGWDSLQLCRDIRKNSVLGRTPLLFLVSENAPDDRILALDSGADDCVTKPVNPRELVARVLALVRRRARQTSNQYGEAADFIIDTSAMTLSVRGAEVATTTLEFRLIEYLAQHQGKVFTRDRLLDAVWGDMQFVTPRSVDACVRRIREKIEPDRQCPTFLKTIRGVGYRLDAVARWHSSFSRDCSCAACKSPLVSSPKIYPGTVRQRGRAS